MLQIRFAIELNMSDSKGFWSAIGDGLYLGFVSLPPVDGTAERRCGHFFDPTPDRDDVQSLYADAVTDGDQVTVLLVKMVQDELRVSDVTREIHEEVNAYLRARGDDDLPPLSSGALPNSFLTHVALWADGEFGSMLDYAPPNDDARMERAAQDFVSRYGHVAVNVGLTGVILLMTHNEDGWVAREVGTAPAPKTVVEAGPDGGL